MVVNNQSLHCHPLTFSGDVGKASGKVFISCAFSDLSLCPFSHCSQLLAQPGPGIHLEFPWPCLCHYLCEFVAPGFPTEEEALGMLGARQHKGHTFSPLYELIFPPATNSIPRAGRWELCAIYSGHGALF